MSLWNRLTAFLERRNIERPDGRPLYAYKCNHREFNELLTAFRLAVRQGLRPGQPGRMELGAEAAFCLLGAEWWRRHHEGGSWKWQGIFDEAGWSDLSVPSIYPVMRDGIRWWQRHLLDLPHGTGYLVTLACEGGLPLKLIQKESSSLKTYFRRLALDFARYQPGGATPEALARRAGAALPVSLQQEEVYHLCGQLMAGIFELQGLVGESRTPVLDLDRQRPRWRDSLPLVVEDDAARSLLKGLVEDVQRAARGRPGGFRLVRRLEQAAAGWRLSSELLCPKTVGSEHLMDLFGLTDEELSGRMNLCSVDAQGASSPLALLSELPAQEDAARTFQVEVPARVSRSREGLSSLRPFEVQLHADRASSTPVAVPGGDELSELPWVYLPIKDDPTRFQLAGEGTVRTRADHALVMIPHAYSSAIEGKGRLAEIAVFPEIERHLLELSGSARFLDEDGSCFRVHTSQEADEAYEYRLFGRMFPWGRRRPIYLGLPKLREYQRTEQNGLGVRSLSPMQLEWRSATPGAPWQSSPEGCQGSVIVRYRSDETVHYQTRALVAPPDAHVRLEPGTSFRQGQIHLEQFGGSAVGVEANEELATTIETPPGSPSHVVSCQTSGDTLPDVPLFVRFENGAELPLSIPFPSRGARFIDRRGNALGHDAFLALDELAGVRVLATSIRDSDRFRIVAEFSAQDTAPALKRVLHLGEQLQQVGAGVHELDLRRIQSHLESVFALSLDLDAMIQLRVEAERGDPIPRRVLFVQRFDADLKLHKAAGTVSLATTEASADDNRDLSELRFEAFPLWNPSVTAKTLDPLDATSWSFQPESRAPGPWMITGWQGARLRARPTLWCVEPSPLCDPEIVREVAAEQNELARAVCLATSNERAEAFDELLIRLGKSPEDPLWNELFPFIRLCEDLPATTLDLVDRLVQHPQTLVMALFQAPDEATYDILWRLEQALPFRWELIPLKAWEDSARVYLQAQAKLLDQCDLYGENQLAEALDSVFERCPDRRPYFQTLKEWLRYRCLNKGLPEVQHLAIAASPVGRPVLRQHLQQACNDLLRRHADARWPSGAHLEACVQEQGIHLQGESAELVRQFQGHGYSLPAFTAPLVTAQISAQGGTLDPPSLYQLERLQQFDPEWFDEAYWKALTMILGEEIETHQKEPNR